MELISGCAPCPCAVCVFLSRELGTDSCRDQQFWAQNSISVIYLLYHFGQGMKVARETRVMCLSHDDAWKMLSPGFCLDLHCPPKGPYVKGLICTLALGGNRNW